jgi:hypothetical protein
VPTNDLNWYNGVGGMLSGLFNQEDLYQYVFDYCRNTLAGAVVSAKTNPNVLAPMPLNLDGGDIVNGYYLHPFPSYVSYVAGEEFLLQHPDPISATVQAWCCASENCNTAATPFPRPPSSPPTLVSSGGRTRAHRPSAAGHCYHSFHSLVQILAMPMLAMLLVSSMRSWTYSWWILQPCQRLQPLSDIVRDMLNRDQAGQETGHDSDSTQYVANRVGCDADVVPACSIQMLRTEAYSFIPALFYVLFLLHQQKLRVPLLIFSFNISTRFRHNTSSFSPWKVHEILHLCYLLWPFVLFLCTHCLL